ncbi:MAG: DUF3604 domain-containing protein [Steroidobacteraceae bacterium]
MSRGLVMYRQRGIDPLQLGAVASTDTHNGTAGYVGEADWRGTFGPDFAAAVRFSLFPDANRAAWSGCGEQNTRASIFAALKRRETFATSGPRIVLKFFAVAGRREATPALSRTRPPARSRWAARSRARRAPGTRAGA